MAVKIILAVVLLVVVADAWVRLAPSNPARWHVPPRPEAGNGDGWAVRVIAGDAGVLASLDAIARATPRTRTLAGSVDEGMVTYVTRSRLWGFPDYTTVARADGRITLYARQRFGSSDAGVNAARLEDWLKRLQAVQK